MEKAGRSFFWQGNSLKKKYHLVRWEIVCKSKKKGGLGLKNIRKLNISLLCKWWWRLENEEGLWQMIVKYKYLRGKPICAVKSRNDDSPVWSDLLKIRHLYLIGRTCKVNNSGKTRFWLDKWLEDQLLYLVYPTLFACCTNHDILVKEVREDGWVIHFTSQLPIICHGIWYDLARKLNLVNYNENEDEIRWQWDSKKVYTV